MTGFLVVNHFYRSKKLDELHSHLIKTADDMGIKLVLKTNLDMIFCTDAPDFVLFWDKDIMLAKSLESRGIPVFNSSSAIELCDDKARTYLALDGIVPQPRTIIAPLSFFDTDYTEFLENAAAELGTPFVLKDRCGSFGEQVHLCHSVADALENINGKPFIVQEYIECGNRDARLEVVGGEIVASMERYNENDFRANVTNGGTATPYAPTDEEKHLAITACEALGLDFGGVDLMKNLVCEVNSNAHIINIMEATGTDVARKILAYITEQVRG